MSPLANNTIAENSTLQLTSTQLAAAIALAPGAPVTAAPAAQATDATLILSAFSPATRRQLELTVNALSRSFRKAIRHAERLERDNAPFEEQDAAWERVNHRSALLQDFIRSLALPTPPPPAAAAEPGEVFTPEPSAPAIPLISAINQKLPETLPALLATPTVSGEDAHFTEYLTEFRHIHALPTTCRAERRRQERALHKLNTKISRQGDAFANRIRAAMDKITAEASAENHACENSSG